MPIADIQWYLEIDVDSAADSTVLALSDTFLVSRASTDYTSATTANEVGGLIVSSVNGNSATGDLGSDFGTVSTVASGVVSLSVADQRIKWVATLARWAGSDPSTLLSDNTKGTNWSKGYSW
jgi:hypothetical protein